MFNRRSLLKYAGALPFTGAMPRYVRAADEVTPGKADYAVRIGTGLVELSPEHIRVKPGERVLFHVLNASATEIPQRQ
jgi:hypothetical protein